MNQNDIEDILEQYGNDRRQQQQAAGTLHSLARRQKRRVLTVCAAVLVAASVWTLRQLATPRQAERTVVARHEAIATPQAPTQEPDQVPVPQKPCSIAQHNTKPGATAPRPLPEPRPTQEVNAPRQTTDPAAPAATPSSSGTDSTQPSAPSRKDTPQHPGQPYDFQDIMLADNTAFQPSEGNNRRFRLAASIGASALPRIGAGNADITENALPANPYSNTTAPYTSVSPSSTLAANVGINYSIPLGKGQGLEVGVALSGYSHQAEVTTYDFATTNGIDGGGATAIHPVGEPELSSTFSLYASLPLTFNFTPQGKDIGWNLSIAPSHSLAASRPTGIKAGNSSVLNPWRLTMGVGLALPHGPVRRISLTANLLSLYTSSRLHEIGIEIGF